MTKSLQLTHSAIATQKIKNKCSLHFPLGFSKIIAENTWVLAQTRGGAVLPVFWKRQYHLPFFSLLFSPLKGNYSPVAIRQSPTASLVEVGEVTLVDVRVLSRFRLLFAPEARERCGGGGALPFAPQYPRLLPLPWLCYQGIPNLGLIPVVAMRGKPWITWWPPLSLQKKAEQSHSGCGSQVPQGGPWSCLATQQGLEAWGWPSFQITFASTQW